MTELKTDRIAWGKQKRSQTKYWAEEKLQKFTERIVCIRKQKNKVTVRML